MKNSIKFKTFVYVNMNIFAVLFQFLIANAGLTDPSGQRLSIEPYGPFYIAYLNGRQLGPLDKAEILKSLKGLDYNNLSRMRDLLNITKAHLDIYGIFQTILLGYLITQRDPVHYAGTLEVIYIFWKSKQTIKHLKDLGEENIDIAFSLSAGTAISPFVGMAVEGILRDRNFKMMLDFKDTLISHRQFEIYTKLIKKYVAKAI